MEAATESLIAENYMPKKIYDNHAPRSHHHVRLVSWIYRLNSILMNFKDHILSMLKFYAQCVEMERITDEEVAQAIIEGMKSRAVGVATEIRAKLAPIL